MDQIGPEFRRELERKIIKLMMIGISQGTFSQNETQVVAKFVLEELPKLHSQADLTTFYNYIAQKWPVLSPLAQLENAKASESHKEEILQGTMDKIHKGDIDGALNTLKGVSA